MKSNRPISDTEAVRLVRDITARRDEFAKFTVPWYRYQEILDMITRAQNETAKL